MRLKLGGIVLFALVLLLSMPTVAKTIQNPEFVITIPDDWVEIPQDVIVESFQRVIAEAPNLKMPKVDYGFQVKTVSNELNYPYLMILINNAGRLTERQLKDMANGGINNRTKEEISKSKPLISDIKNEIKYDKTTKIIWITSKAEGTTGKISGLLAVIPTQKGTINVQAYATEATFTNYVPVFQQIITSLKVSPELAYQPRWTDNIPIIGNIDWRMFLKRYLNYSIFSLLIALVFLFGKWWRGRITKSNPQIQ
jgi:hypothetical protein